MAIWLIKTQKMMCNATLRVKDEIESLVSNVNRLQGEKVVDNVGPPCLKDEEPQYFDEVWTFNGKGSKFFFTSTARYKGVQPLPVRSYVGSAPASTNCRTIFTP